MTINNNPQLFAVIGFIVGVLISFGFQQQHISTDGTESVLNSTQQPLQQQQPQQATFAVNDTAVSSVVAVGRPECQQFGHFGAVYMFNEYYNAYRPPYWGSQVGQDRTVAHLFSNMKGGVFVELAANDAFRFSNSVGLEYHLKWTGLCIEINPRYHVGLSKRKCTAVSAVVGDGSPKWLDFTFGKQGWDGGLVGFDQKNIPAARVVKVKTVRLNDVLDVFGVTNIDYFSLDVEGAEYFIMKDFDFKKHRIGVLTVERPNKELQDLIARNGFVYLKDHGNFGDKMYLNHEYAKAKGITWNLP